MISLAGWAVAGIVSGTLLGQLYKPSGADAVIPVALFLMLFPAMLEVDFSGIKRALAQPQLLMAALVINFVVSPLLIFVMIRTLAAGSGPRFTAGIILFAAVPCGGMVPAFTGMLGGNVNLSATITAISLALSLAIVPFWTKCLIGPEMSVPAMLVFRHLCFIIVIPLAPALLARVMIVRSKGAKAFSTFRNRMKRLSGLGLFLFLSAMSLLYGDRIFHDTSPVLNIAIPVAGFLMILLILSGLCAKVVGACYEEAVAFTLSTTAKNNAIALALAFTTFGADATLVNAVAGPLVQLPLMLSFVALMRRLGTQRTCSASGSNL